MSENYIKCTTCGHVHILGYCGTSKSACPLFRTQRDVTALKNLLTVRLQQDIDPLKRQKLEAVSHLLDDCKYQLEEDVK